MSSASIVRHVAVSFLLGIVARSFLHMHRVNAGFPEQSVGALAGAVLLVGMVWLSLLKRYRAAFIGLPPTVIPSRAEGSRTVILFLLLVLSFFLGVVRFELSLPARVTFPSTPSSVSGVVRELRLEKSKSAGTFQLHLPSGIIIVRFADSSVRITEGEAVEVFCRIKPPARGFQDPFTGPYRKVFRQERLGVVGACEAQAITVHASVSLLERVRLAPDRFRSSLVESARALLPGPPGIVLGSIVFGVDEQLPTEIIEQFKRAGTLHILVVSGSQFTLLTEWLDGMLASVLPTVAARAAAISGFLLFFLAMIGFPVPAVRGFLLSLSGLAARVLGRPRAAVHLLLLIAAGMSVADPWLPLFSLGFQLSVLATLGIVALSGQINTLVFGETHARFPNASSAFSSSIAASVSTLPLLLGAFGNVSIISIVANVVAGAFSLLLLSGALLFFLLVAVLPSVAALLAPMVGFAINLFVGLMASFADVPWASVLLGRVPGALVLVYYAFFLLLCWIGSARKTTALHGLPVSGTIADI